MDDVRWKFIAAMALSAMVVSFFVGGLSGIAFGTLLVRGLGGGFVLALLAFGANILAVRFLPEIFEAESAAESVQDSPGSRVDIVMPAEMPDDSPTAAGNHAAGSEAGSFSAGPQVQDGPPGDASSDGGHAPPDAAPEISADGDLDRFSEAFDDVDTDEGSVSSGGNDSGKDPQEIARAIQTVMKRDEKG